MKQHRGAVSVLMISLLIGIAAVLSLSVLRTLIQSQHIAQHRMDNVIREWQVKGIAECVSAKVRQQPFSTDFKTCTENEKIRLEVSKAFSRHVSIHEHHSQLDFNLDLPQPDAHGVIKSTMGLVFLNPLTISPDVGKKVGEKHWKCSSVIYSNGLYAQSLSSSHPYLSPHHSDWDEISSDAHCSSDSYSVSLMTSDAKADFRHDSELNLFEDLWHTSRSEWFEIMSHSSVGHVPERFENLLDGMFLYSMVTELPLPIFNLSCAAQIENQILKGKRIIWVYGGCELNEDHISDINHAIELQFEQGGIILVVQDGVLSVHADTSINALIMNLMTRSDVDYASQWHGVENVTEVISDIAHQPYSEINATLDLDSLAYYQSGLFYPKGGLVLIGLDKYAVIKTSYFAFQSNVITQALAQIRPVTLKKGSWYEK